MSLHFRKYLITLSVSEADILSLFVVSIQHFLPLDNQTKNPVGEILIFVFFQELLFSEENAYFIKTCQKQTRQVIKICPNDCLDQGVKKTCIVMLIMSSCPNPATNELFKVNLYTSRN